MPRIDMQGIKHASALAGLQAASSPAPDSAHDPVAIHDDGLTDKINLRCRADNKKLARNLLGAVGAPLPRRPDVFTSAGSRAIMRLGPDEWLILTESGAGGGIIAAIDRPDGDPVAVTDVSDALGSITISGSRARAVLAKHCPLDFHGSVFTPMMVASSHYARAQVTILCLEENAFRIIGRTSFMPYIARLMMDASIEYGYEFRPRD